MSPVVQKIHVGRPWVINCSVSGHPIHGVHWRKDVDVLSLDGRVSQISRDVIRIDPVQREDRGMYQCIAYNDQDTAQAAVELTLGDDVPELQETFEEQTIQPGPSLSLKCVASGNPLPQIVWRLDDAPIPENHRIRFGDYVTKDGFVVSFVNISNVKTEDGGDYRCVANNGVGEVSHESRVNVLGPPVVVRRARNVTVVAGDVLVLRCPVAGYPLENIHWERTGVRLPYNHRQKAHDNGTLEVHHVERATDQGPYVCVATNRAGQTAQSTVIVRVQVKPVIEPFNFPKSLMEGQRSSVHCTVSSGDLPFKIRWFKDGRPIPDNIGVRTSEVADYSSTLLFESLALHHKGNYTCVAENEAGTVSHTATMVIHVSSQDLIFMHLQPLSCKIHLIKQAKKERLTFISSN
ncbi:down syndrome cell adhesion molecule-like protein Dscam2 [Trichonephila inaurata madagascariensis]|uniref:Down syndrome cell adhesion molecule-like protein Dscam2 n=1 Tax=Trichonephila inaurata madagascariensis TaxID=2747483 RepID=A0A8X6X5V6_9ARAC|nr:down syndrome cell adhesion molecule-like protein Dscam2 [Trichonephila inaurata madagascariensis]